MVLENLLASDFNRVFFLLSIDTHLTYPPRTMSRVAIEFYPAGGRLR